MLVPTSACSSPAGSTPAACPSRRAEVFDDAQRLFLSLPDDPRLDARVRPPRGPARERRTRAGRRRPIRGRPGARLDGVRQGARRRRGRRSAPARPLATARYDHAAVGGRRGVRPSSSAASAATACRSPRSKRCAAAGTPAAFTPIASLQLRARAGDRLAARRRLDPRRRRRRRRRRHAARRRRALQPDHAHHHGDCAGRGAPRPHRHGPAPTGACSSPAASATRRQPRCASVELFSPERRRLRLRASAATRRAQTTSPCRCATAPSSSSAARADRRDLHAAGELSQRLRPYFSSL